MHFRGLVDALGWTLSQLQKSQANVPKLRNFLKAVENLLLLPSSVPNRY